MSDEDSACLLGGAGCQTQWYERKRTRSWDASSEGRGSRGCMGHVARMRNDRRAKQVLNWDPGRKRGRRRPMKNWRSPSWKTFDVEGCSRRGGRQGLMEEIGNIALPDVQFCTGMTKV